MRTPLPIFRLILSAILALPGATALADPLYTLTLLGGTGSTSTDINRWGDVVGNTGTRGFTWLGGKYVDLDTLGGNRSEAFAINNLGVIVGNAHNGDPATLGFGQAFSYAGGAMHDLGTLPGGLGSNAYAINNAGLIGGSSYEGPFTVPEYPFHAVLFSGGSVHGIGAPEPGDSAIYGLNDAGLAVGGIPSPGFAHASHAILYGHGTLIDLGVLDPAALDDSIALDINNHGQIVGRSAVLVDPEHYGYHGFLATDAGLVDLNTLIDPTSGWVITDASGINDAAQIAATACYGGVTGDCRAVRLDLMAAVPEPGSLATLGLGLLLIGARTRRSRRLQA